MMNLSSSGNGDIEANFTLWSLISDSGSRQKQFRLVAWGFFQLLFLDACISLIYNVGAEPLICLGLPMGGMTTGADTGLPSIESFEQYAAEIAECVKQMA